MNEQRQIIVNDGPGKAKCVVCREAVTTAAEALQHRIICGRQG